MYDFIIDLVKIKNSIIIVYLSCSPHVNKFSTVLTAYVIWYNLFCAIKNVFIIELEYVSRLIHM